MPKAILEFNLSDPEEKDAFELATKALNYKIALYDLYTFLRQKTKYECDNMPTEEYEAYQKVIDFMSDILDEGKVDIFD